MTAKEGLLFLFGTLLDDCQKEQGKVWKMNSIGMRIFLALFILGAFVLTTAYRGSQFSFYTVPPVSAVEPYKYSMHFDDIALTCASYFIKTINNISD